MYLTVCGYITVHRGALVNKRCRYKAFSVADFPCTGNRASCPWYAVLWLVQQQLIAYY